MHKQVITYSSCYRVDGLKLNGSSTYLPGYPPSLHKIGARALQHGMAVGFRSAGLPESTNIYMDSQKILSQSGEFEVEVGCSSDNIIHTLYEPGTLDIDQKCPESILRNTREKSLTTDLHLPHTSPQSQPKQSSTTVTTIIEPSATTGANNNKQEDDDLWG